MQITNINTNNKLFLECILLVFMELFLWPLMVMLKTNTSLKVNEISLSICLSPLMSYRNNVIFRQHCWHGLWWRKTTGQVSSCCQFLAGIPSENEQSKKFWSSQLQNTNCMVSGWQFFLVMKWPNDLEVGKLFQIWLENQYWVIPENFWKSSYYT